MHDEEQDEDPASVAERVGRTLYAPWAPGVALGAGMAVGGMLPSAKAARSVRLGCLAICVGPTTTKHHRAIGQELFYGLPGASRAVPGDSGHGGAAVSSAARVSVSGRVLGRVIQAMGAPVVKPVAVQRPAQLHPKAAGPKSSAQPLRPHPSFDPEQPRSSARADTEPASRCIVKLARSFVEAELSVMSLPNACTSVMAQRAARRAGAAVGAAGSPGRRASKAARRVRFCTFDLSTVESVPPDIVVPEDEDSLGDDSDGAFPPSGDALPRALAKAAGAAPPPAAVPDTPVEQLLFKLEAAVAAAVALRGLSCPSQDVDEAGRQRTEAFRAVTRCACGDLRAAEPSLAASPPPSASSSVAPAAPVVGRETALCLLGSLLAFLARLAAADSEAEANVFAPRPPLPEGATDAGAHIDWASERSAAAFLCAELSCLRVRHPNAPLPWQRRLSDLVSSAARLQLRRAFNPHVQPGSMPYVFSQLMQAMLRHNGGADALADIAPDALSSMSVGSVSDVGGLGRGGGASVPDEKHLVMLSDGTGTLNYNGDDLAALVHKALDSMYTLRSVVQRVISPLTLASPEPPIHASSSSPIAAGCMTITELDVVPSSGQGLTVFQLVDKASPEDAALCGDFAEAHNFICGVFAIPEVQIAANGQGHAWKRLRRLAGIARRFACGSEAHLILLERPDVLLRSLQAEAAGVHKLRAASKRAVQRHWRALARAKRSRFKRARTLINPAHAPLDPMPSPSAASSSHPLARDGFPMMSPPIAAALDALEAGDAATPGPFPPAGSPSSSAAASGVAPHVGAHHHGSPPPRSSPLSHSALSLALSGSDLGSSHVSTSSTGDDTADRQLALLQAEDLLDPAARFRFPQVSMMSDAQLASGSSSDDSSGGEHDNSSSDDDDGDLDADGLGDDGSEDGSLGQRHIVLRIARQPNGPAAGEAGPAVVEAVIDVEDSPQGGEQGPEAPRSKRVKAPPPRSQSKAANGAGKSHLQRTAAMSFGVPSNDAKAVATGAQPTGVSLVVQNTAHERSHHADRASSSSPSSSSSTGQAARVGASPPSRSPGKRAREPPSESPASDPQTARSTSRHGLRAKPGLARRAHMPAQPASSEPVAEPAEAGIKANGRRAAARAACHIQRLAEEASRNGDSDGGEGSDGTFWGV